MIKVYSNPNCIQCERTKLFLEQKGFEYEAKMLQDSPEIYSLIEEKGYKTAPIVVTDNDSWSGFNLDKLNSLL